MSASIYHTLQYVFPSLLEQTIPQYELDHFGDFFDWINLNATYLQPFYSDQPTENGFEFNDLLLEHQVSISVLIDQLTHKIQKLKNKPQHNIQLLQQDIFRQSILHTQQFLAQYQLDFLLLSTPTQYFWLSFPYCSTTQRFEICQQFKLTFAAEHAITVLDPQILARFVH